MLSSNSKTFSLRLNSPHAKDSPRGIVESHETDAADSCARCRGIRAHERGEERQTMKGGGRRGEWGVHSAQLLPQKNKQWQRCRKIETTFPTLAPPSGGWANQWGARFFNSNCAVRVQSSTVADA